MKTLTYLIAHVVVQDEFGSNEFHKALGTLQTHLGQEDGMHADMFFTDALELSEGPGHRDGKDSRDVGWQQLTLTDRVKLIQEYVASELEGLLSTKFEL